MAEVSKEYKIISQIAGPLVFVKKTDPVAYGELVSVKLSDGSMKRGEVLDTSDDIVVVQIYEGTTGIDRDASVRFLGVTRSSLSCSSPWESPTKRSRCS